MTSTARQPGPTKRGTRRRRARAAPQGYVLQVPIHALVEYEGAGIKLRSENALVRPYLESRDWWGACRDCGYELSGDDRVDWNDRESAIFYSSLRDCVEAALSLLDDDLDLRLSLGPYRITSDA